MSNFKFRGGTSPMPPLQTPVAACGDLTNVAIGNPERHMRKAAHCGSKQQ